MAVFERGPNDTGRAPLNPFLKLALELGPLAVFFFGNARGDWLYVLVACVAGPASEALLIEAGVFSYANPDFANIPIWLVPLWANGGLMLRRVLAPIALRQPSSVLPSM